MNLPFDRNPIAEYTLCQRVLYCQRRSSIGQPKIVGPGFVVAIVVHLDLVLATRRQSKVGQG